MVKWLRHRPFTAVTRVRIPLGSPFFTLIPGRLAQLGEHLPYKQRVGGSSPSTSTIYAAGWSSWQLVGLITRRSQVQVLPPQPFGSVAQSVEQRTENPRVGGSIPSRATIPVLPVSIEASSFNKGLLPFRCSNVTSMVGNAQLFYGGVAQLVRAHGSYPWCRWFESTRRYQFVCTAESTVFPIV